MAAKKKHGRARRATAATKRAAVTEYNNSGAKLADMAAKYGTSLMTMSRWVREASLRGEQQAKPTHGRPAAATETEDTELRRLRAENAELRRKLHKAMELLLDRTEL